MQDIGEYQDGWIVSNSYSTADNVSSGSIRLQWGENYILFRTVQTSKVHLGCQHHELLLLQP